MGSCASVEDPAENGRNDHQARIPIESYFMDREDLTATELSWLDVIEDIDDWISEPGNVPTSIRERAPGCVVERCTADPTQWKRFMFRELNRTIGTLDEAFEQCRKFAPPTAIGKGKHVALASDEVDGDLLSSRTPLDAFSGSAVTYLVDLLGATNEIVVLFALYKLILCRDTRSKSLLALTPSKMKSEGLKIDEWAVRRREWMTGWVSLECFGLTDARSKLRALASEFASLPLDSSELKAFHKFLFRFLPKDHTVQQEAVPKDEAVRLWSLELGAGKWSLGTLFCNFVQFRYPKRVVTVDQWDMLIEFALSFQYEINLLQYEGHAASPWPLLMDEFIEDTMRLLQEQQEQEGSMGALSQC